MNDSGIVVAVCKKAEPGLPKFEVETIQLIEDFGVDGDYHAGKLVRHRYLAEKDPTQPNVRQVLLVDKGIHADVAKQGIELRPGMMGENILIDGLDVMALALGTQVEIGETLLEVTEVRNPCHQLDDLQPGLLDACIVKEDVPEPRRAGMMTRILRGGEVKAGDIVTVRPKN